MDAGGAPDDTAAPLRTYEEMMTVSDAV